MAALVGNWTFASAENLEKYMEASGVPEQLREVARNSKPFMEITNSGDSWTIKTTVGDKVKDTTFTIGQEFESKSLIGSPLKCIVKLEGDKMVETQKDGDAEVLITREVNGTELVSSMTFKGTVATVRFNKS